MLWALKRTLSMRRFFWAPRTYMFKLMSKKIFTILRCFFFCLSKPVNKTRVSMTRKCHTHRSLTNPWHREEEVLGHRQRQRHWSNQFSLPQRNDCLCKSCDNMGGVIIYSLHRPFRCFTTNQFAQKFNFLADLITYFVIICNILYVNPWSDQCDHLQRRGHEKGENYK